MNHMNRKPIWIAMSMGAAAIITLSLFTGWNALALLLICPIIMLGMMLMMMGDTNHGGHNNTHRRE